MKNKKYIPSIASSLIFCTSRIFIFVSLYLLFFLSGNGSAFAQSSCRDDITLNDGYKIRSVKIKGRWVPSLKDLGFEHLINEPYSPQKVSDIQTKISADLSKEENKAIEMNLLGSTSGLYITSCVKADEQLKVVDIIITPYYLRLDIHNTGSNILPIPRTFEPTFYQNVPKPLLLLNPKFKVNYDREYGFSPSFSVSSNLLELKNLASNKKVTEGKNRLDIVAEAKKSVDKSFYEINASLSFTQQRTGQTIEDLKFGIDYTNNLTPQGEGRKFENSVKAGGGVKFRLKRGVVESLNIDANYRHSRNNFSRQDGTRFEKTSENAFEGRILTDGKIADGFTRFALWFDSASITSQNTNYQRLAAALGYEKEFGKNNQTVGLEVLLGGGRTWGQVPEYARFFGGNSGKNFLYESPKSSSLTKFPTGPLIRSFGNGQLAPQNNSQSTIRGGTSYWNLNLNLAFPVPKLSRSLIPDIIVELPSGTQIPLKQQLKNVTNNTSLNTLTANFEADGLSPQEAQGKATQIVNNEIKPITNFVANKANIFALKPLFMFDAASINSPENPNERTRIAIGGGVQVVVILTRFELGYMRTIRFLPNDQRGNFVFRLTFQNLL